MKKKTLPPGLIDTGQTIDLSRSLPTPEFNLMLESDPQMALASPVIPLLRAVKWADERICCGYARRSDIEGAPACPSLYRGDDGGTWCALNGREQKSPCVFAEPENSVIWQRIRAQIKFSERS